MDSDGQGGTGLQKVLSRAFVLTCPWLTHRVDTDQIEPSHIVYTLVELNNPVLIHEATAFVKC